MNVLEKKVDALINLILCKDATEKETILNSLREMIEDSKAPAPVSNFRDKVAKALIEVGTPHNVLGYRYLVKAVSMVIEDFRVADNITKVLYPAVAEEFDTTPSRVERAIRHAIEITWDRSDTDVLYKYFGNTISVSKGKPTNSEFITLLADTLR